MIKTKLTSFVYYRNVCVRCARVKKTIQFRWTRKSEFIMSLSEHEMQARFDTEPMTNTCTRLTFVCEWLYCTYWATMYLPLIRYELITWPITVMKPKNVLWCVSKQPKTCHRVNTVYYKNTYSSFCPMLHSSMILSK